jgi:glycosyltransferase involved in cell wall biosynthesis
MSAKNILYLTHDGLTDALGQSQVLPYVLGLSKLGFRISLISLEKEEAYQASQESIAKSCLESNVKWYPLTYHHFPPILSSIYNLWQMKDLAWKLQSVSQFEIVHCRSYLTSLIGIRMKKTFGVRFLFDMRGFWADERKESGLWNTKNPFFSYLYHFFKNRERDFLREADHIVSLTNNAKQELEGKSVGKPITIIPTCTDLEKFDPSRFSKAEKDDLRIRLRILPNDFILLYLGSWGTWYKANEMILFFNKLKAKIPSARFLILTNNPGEVKGLEFQDGYIVKKVNGSEVPLYLSIVHASVFFIISTYSKKASSATKLGELLAMNIPVVTNAGWGDVDQIIETTQCGILIEDFTDIELEKAVEDLLLHRKESDLRRVSKAYFDLHIGIERYQKIYHSLID